MKYSVKVREVQESIIWYEVEADSKEEAEKCYDEFMRGEIVDEEFSGVIESEILEIEPLVEEE